MLVSLLISPNKVSPLMASQEERIAKRVEQKLVRATMQSFSGPLPPPNLLSQYNLVVPNGAERIMAMAEKQQEHRQGIEHCVVHGNKFDQRLGLVLGFIVMMTVAAAGVWCVSIGKDITGLTALVTAVGGPVTAFIYGRKKQAKERADKA